MTVTATMLEHYPHIRIDAKRQALDALDDAWRAATNGNEETGNAKIETIVEVADDLTSESRHSLLLSGSPPSGKLLIPLHGLHFQLAATPSTLLCIHDTRR